jgi:predicted aconitase with swiveling domain
MTAETAVLFAGEAGGVVLKLAAPLCFWGGLDAATGLISDPKHPDHGASVTGRILAVPKIVGSSSSSQILLERLYSKTQPAAIILGEADAIIAMACLVGREMGYATIPILHRRLDDLETGTRVSIEGGGRVTSASGAP